MYKYTKYSATLLFLMPSYPASWTGLIKYSYKLITHVRKLFIKFINMVMDLKLGIQISDYNTSCTCTCGTIKNYVNFICIGKAMYKFVLLYCAFQFLFSIFNLFHHGFNIIDANSLCWVSTNQNQWTYGLSRCGTIFFSWNPLKLTSLCFYLGYNAFYFLCCRCVCFNQCICCD